MIWGLQQPEEDKKIKNPLLEMRDSSAYVSKCQHNADVSIAEYINKFLLFASNSWLV
jgi:hypothetical protein